MPRRPRPCWQALLALSAALAILGVSVAAVVPGHWHNSPQGRICDICRTGFLVAPVPMHRVQVQSPAPIGWHQACIELHSEFDPVLSSSPPRAPPV